MPKMIQIRNVPDSLHRTLKLKAVAAGMTLSDFLCKELETIASKMTYAEFQARVAAQPRLRVAETPVHAVRAERDAR
jgi:plasmid stability protein